MTRAVEDPREQVQYLLKACQEDASPELGNVLVQVQYPAGVEPDLDLLATEARAFYGESAPPKSLLFGLSKYEDGTAILDLWIPRCCWEEKRFGLHYEVLEPETAADVRERYGHLLDAEKEPESEGPPAMWDPRRAVAGTWVLADERPGEVAPKVVRIGWLDDGDLNIEGNFYSPETGRRTWEGETGRAYMLAAPASQEDPPGTWDPFKAVAGQWVLVDEDAGNREPYMAQIPVEYVKYVTLINGITYANSTGKSLNGNGRLYMLDLTE